MGGWSGLGLLGDPAPTCPQRCLDVLGNTRCAMRGRCAASRRCLGTTPATLVPSWPTLPRTARLPAHSFQHRSRYMRRASAPRVTPSRTVSKQWLWQPRSQGRRAATSLCSCSRSSRSAPPSAWSQVVVPAEPQQQTSPNPPPVPRDPTRSPCSGSASRNAAEEAQWQASREPFPLQLLRTSCSPRPRYPTATVAAQSRGFPCPGSPA